MAYGELQFLIRFGGACESILPCGSRFTVPWHWYTVEGSITGQKKGSVLFFLAGLFFPAPYQAEASGVFEND